MAPPSPPPFPRLLSSPIPVAQVPQTPRKALLNLRLRLFVPLQASLLGTICTMITDIYVVATGEEGPRLCALLLALLLQPGAGAAGPGLLMTALTVTRTRRIAMVMVVVVTTMMRLPCGALPFLCVNLRAF